MRALGLAVLLIGLPLSASALFAPQDPVADAPSAPEASPREWSLPADWRTSDPLRFEHMLEEQLAPAAPLRLADAELAELSAALAEPAQVGVRAVVLLARSGDERAAEQLLSRLEARDPAPGRADDAGDSVAAAALGAGLAGAEAARAPQRLEALAAGEQPHPDLEVRTECAAAALELGRRGGVPYLLQVLRIGTWAGRSDVWESQPGQNTAWARSRAAEALSRAAGVPCTFSTDASIADREREAAALAGLLR